MKAVDTNILARYILDDDPKQSPIATRIVSEGAFVPITVLLETGWLLRSRYGLQRGELADALAGLLEVPSIVIPEEQSIREAITLYRAGADLADAIHLVASRGSEAFVTFDRDLARRSDTPIPVELA